MKHLKHILQYTFIGIVAFGLFSRCNSKEKMLKGSWAIDAYLVDGKDIKSNFFSSAIRVFSEDSLKLPITDVIEHNTDVQKGAYVFYKKSGKDYLEVKTKNKYFNYTFQITCLYKETDDYGGSRFRMQLEHEKIQIVFSRLPKFGE